MPVEVKSIITPRSWSSWRLWASWYGCWKLSSGPLQEHPLNYVQCLLHSLSTPSELRAHRLGSATGQQDLGDAVSALMLGFHVCVSASSCYTGSSECVCPFMASTFPTELSFQSTPVFRLTSCQPDLFSSFLCSHHCYLGKFQGDRLCVWSSLTPQCL